MGTLSHALINLGVFFSPEISDSSENFREVKITLADCGVPNTYDYNDWVSVVFDEEGRLWIALKRSINKEIFAKLFEVLLSYHALHGNYVAH